LLLKRSKTLRHHKNWYKTKKYLCCVLKKRRITKYSSSTKQEQAYRDHPFFQIYFTRIYTLNAKISSASIVIFSSLMVIAPKRTQTKSLEGTSRPCMHEGRRCFQKTGTRKRKTIGMEPLKMWAQISEGDWEIAESIKAYTHYHRDHLPLFGGSPA